MKWLNYCWGQACWCELHLRKLRLHEHYFFWYKRSTKPIFSEPIFVSRFNCNNLTSPHWYRKCLENGYESCSPVHLRFRTVHDNSDQFMINVIKRPWTNSPRASLSNHQILQWLCGDLPSMLSAFINKYTDDMHDQKVLFWIHRVSAYVTLTNSFLLWMWVHESWVSAMAQILLLLFKKK